MVCNTTEGGMSPYWNSQLPPKANLQEQWWSHETNAQADNKQ